MASEKVSFYIFLDGRLIKADGCKLFIEWPVRDVPNVNDVYSKMNVFINPGIRHTVTYMFLGKRSYMTCAVSYFFDLIRDPATLNLRPVVQDITYGFLRKNLSVNFEAVQDALDDITGRMSENVFRRAIQCKPGSPEFLVSLMCPASIIDRYEKFVENEKENSNGEEDTRKDE